MGEIKCSFRKVTRTWSTPSITVRQTSYLQENIPLLSAMVTCIISANYINLINAQACRTTLVGCHLRFNAAGAGNGTCVVKCLQSLVIISGWKNYLINAIWIRIQNFSKNNSMISEKELRLSLKKVSSIKECDIIRLLDYHVV